MTVSSLSSAPREACKTQHRDRNRPFAKKTGIGVRGRSHNVVMVVGPGQPCARASALLDIRGSSGAGRAGRPGERVIAVIAIHLSGHRHRLRLSFPGRMCCWGPIMTIMLPYYLLSPTAVVLAHQLISDSESHGGSGQFDIRARAR